MILTFEFSGTFTKQFAVDAVSLEEAHALIENQFAMMHHIPVCLCELDDVYVNPVDICEIEKHEVEEEIQDEFFDSDWSEPIYNAVEYASAHCEEGCNHDDA